MNNMLDRSGETIQDPPVAKFLFSNPAAGWLWLIVRAWLGWKWIDAALHKIDNPAWVGTGEALKGYWSNQVIVPESGRPAIAFDWYRGFIQSMLDAEAYVWFGKLVAYGELLIGVALVIGLFTGVAAFFGAFMNWNFIMAGSASTNGLLLVAAILLVLAWKVAGYIGADFFLLRWLGTPWPARDEKTKNTSNGEFSRA